MALNWLVIGIGDITIKRVLPAILASPRGRLGALLTRDPAKAAPYHPARVYTDLEPALADPEIHAVYIATPVFLHAPQTIAALRAGKHVLCEKPVALDFAAAQSMAAAAREAGRTLGIAYYRRTYPKIHRLRQLLADGAIGKPVLAEINCHSWFQDEDGTRSWLLDPAKSGGGPLYDIASHRIDLFNFLFGQPERVSGHVSRTVHTQSAVEDSATVLIDYASRVRGVVDVRWHSRVSRDEFRVIGTEGDVVLSPLNGPSLVVNGGAAEQHPAHANLHAPCVENFTAAVLDGAPLLSSGESAQWTDWVTEQVVKQAR